MRNVWSFALCVHWNGPHVARASAKDPLMADLPLKDESYSSQVLPNCAPFLPLRSTERSELLCSLVRQCRQTAALCHACDTGARPNRADACARIHTPAEITRWLKHL